MTVTLRFNKSLVFILIPLFLTSFTHLWNPAGFPYFHGDEGHYLRRAMHVLDALGPQEQRNTAWTFERPYDHPYFGQLLLAAMLGTINYPNLVDPNLGDVNSITMLHIVPRLLMGILSVVDTFLIYKIVDRRYSRNVAFIAAVFFAVMPMSWLVRRVLLDSLLLPFILFSILFALPSRNQYIKYIKKYENANHKVIIEHNKVLLPLLLSGIFLGFAIFTKISAFAIIPLVAFLIYTTASKNILYNRNKKLGVLALWFAPVILIPLVWPGYALSLGEFDQWMEGVSWQANRSQTSLWNSLIDIFRIDPVLFLLGVSGLLYAAIKRDLLTVLWIIPFIFFFYFVGHVRYYYWIPIIPVLCIAASVMIVGLSNKINQKKVRKILPFATVVSIGIFGLIISTILLTTSNVNSSLFELYAFIVEHLPNSPEGNNYGYANNQKVATIMGSNWMQIFSWIPKYVFDIDNDFKTFLREKNLPVKDEDKVLLLVDDKDFRHFILSENTTKTFKQKQLYNDTNLIATFKEKPIPFDDDRYPYTNIHGNPGLKKGVEVRTNY